MGKKKDTVFLQQGVAKILYTLCIEFMQTLSAQLSWPYKQAIAIAENEFEIYQDHEIYQLENDFDYVVRKLVLNIKGKTIVNRSRLTNHQNNDL